MTGGLGAQNILFVAAQESSIKSWESKVPPPKATPPINSRPYDQGL